MGCIDCRRGVPSRSARNKAWQPCHRSTVVGFLNSGSSAQTWVSGFASSAQTWVSGFGTAKPGFHVRVSVVTVFPVRLRSVLGSSQLYAHVLLTTFSVVYSNNYCT